MRASIFLLLMSLLVACKRAPAPDPAAASPANATETNATAPATANAPRDAPPLTCANIQSCVEKCPLGAALPDCAAACVARLTPAARPFYDALQDCVAPHCAADAAGPCLDPSSMGCKLCAMSHCGSLASTCLLH